jgi:hypothetical protein
MIYYGSSDYKNIKNKLEQKNKMAEKIKVDFGDATLVKVYCT